MEMCAGCDLPLPLNDLGLCEDCSDKLERDLIRQKAWEFSPPAFFLSNTERNALRQRVLQQFGSDYELLPAKVPRKNKRSHSRATQLKRELAQNAIRDYSPTDVLQSASEFLEQQKADWVNFSHLSQHLYQRFYHLKPKRLGTANKKYKSILKFLADYPTLFEFKPDEKAKGVYWIRKKRN